MDYEPGIHYPQLQMQAGTTGINTMRVYSVVKQGLDQDKDGVFVKRCVAELRNVSVEYIHEPWKMTRSVQEKCGVIIGRIHHQQQCFFRFACPRCPAMYVHLFISLHQY